MTDRTDQDKAATRRKLAAGFAKCGSAEYSVWYVDAATSREDAELGIETPVGWQVQRRKADKSAWNRPIREGVKRHATIERIISRDMEALALKNGHGIIATTKMSLEDEARAQRENI